MSCKLRQVKPASYLFTSGTELMETTEVVIAGLGVEQCAIVGHSIGSVVAYIVLVELTLPVEDVPGKRRRIL